MKLSIYDRTATLLERVAYALTILPELIPDERRHIQDKNTSRESFKPSALSLAKEARDLSSEHRRRQSKNERRRQARRVV